MYVVGVGASSEGVQELHTVTPQHHDRSSKNTPPAAYQPNSYWQFISSLVVAYLCFYIMIVYQTGLYGLRDFVRVDGSPVFKVILPTIFSTIVLVLIAVFDTKLDNERSVRHPYNIGAFIAIFSVLLTFRLNFAYQR
jgi:hypothetical protein